MLLIEMFISATIYQFDQSISQRVTKKHHQQQLLFELSMRASMHYARARFRIHVRVCICGAFLL